MVAVEIFTRKAWRLLSLAKWYAGTPETKRLRAIRQNVDAQLATYPESYFVDRLVSLVTGASDSNYLEGMTWYSRESTLIANQGKYYGLLPHTSCAVFAALSPQASVSANYVLFANLCEQPSYNPGTTKRNYVKALRIYQGHSPEAWLGKHKTLSFYRNLAGDVHDVTVDRHAGSACFNISIPCISVRWYTIIQRFYQLAAVTLGIEPRQVQAIAWVQWRENKGITGKYTYTSMSQSQSDLTSEDIALLGAASANPDAPLPRLQQMVEEGF